MIAWIRSFAAGFARGFREESAAIARALNPAHRSRDEIRRDQQQLADTLGHAADAYAERNRGNAPAPHRPRFMAAASDVSRCWHCGQRKARHLPEGHCRREDLAAAPWAPRGAR